MKNSSIQQSEDSSTSSKTAQTKSTKKSTKSRAKSTKAESQTGGGSNKNATPSTSSGSTGGTLIAQQQQQQGTTSNQVNLMPTTPTSSLTGAGGGGSVGVGNHHNKSYVGLEPRSIKIIWEQHDQSDIELSTEVCSRVAEDVSYKLWELVNNIKTYARHSGGVVTYDLVNEVLKDSDVPPCLGAMDSDWDRIDYDGSYFFYSDKILELRDEYQREVSFSIPHGPDFKSYWPVDDKYMEQIKKYVPSLLYAILNGNPDELDTVLSEAAFSPLIGSCYRLILAKIVQIIAFKQTNEISSRCWRLLRALSSNPRTRDVDCREEYYHLAEILVCQLLAPFESIKIQNTQTKDEVDISGQHDPIKMETTLGFPTSSGLLSTPLQQNMDVMPGNATTENCEQIFKLEPDNDEEMEETSICDESVTNMQTSQYFATPVEWDFVDELCETLGMLGALNGYFQSECLFHILRRLKRFFRGRVIQKERDYNYISRSVRGLIALGEYAFREFIPFLYKLNVDEVPESLWNDFNVSSVFLSGNDDIFLYEWLQEVCGADKLQPYLTYYAQFYEKFIKYRFTKKKKSTFKINPKVGVRRLEWNALAAAMCHGDDPNKALKPKPLLNDIFPELKPINPKLNRAGNIRFKFAGCRPVILKPKNKYGQHAENSSISTLNGCSASDVLIAKRRLFKPLTNARKMIPLCSYYYAKI
ncbi:SAGA factor-like TAF6 isoform X2 [Musca autumnalis]|uniref:SAGA factor-like TAF6 isoform X2 n=1 Tax=Musca autumnalis TaxID=221902 RepID=UPI003CF35616